MTNAYDKFCIAGIDSKGKWYRPIPSRGGSRFWNKESLLLSNGKYLKVGDIITFDGIAPDRFSHPNHNEDIIVTSKIKLEKSLNMSSLSIFLKDKIASHSEFEDTIFARNRSLCLIRAEDFEWKLQVWEGTRKVKGILSSSGKCDISNPHTINNDYIIKDANWVSLILNSELGIKKFKNSYICIGLATKTAQLQIEYPQIISIINNNMTLQSIRYCN